MYLPEEKDKANEFRLVLYLDKEGEDLFMKMKQKYKGGNSATGRRLLIKSMLSELNQLDETHSNGQDN